MSRRAPLLLVVGLAAGLAAGYALFHEEAPPPRRQQPLRRPVAPIPSTAAAESAPSGSLPRVEGVDVASMPVIPASGDLAAGAEVAAGLGRLIVDFGDLGLADVYYQALTLSGSYEEWSFNQDDERGVWEDLPPGIYLPYWELPDRLGRWGVRARVDAGRVTRIDARDAFELPLPEGLGRLDVVLRCAAGLALPGVEVFLGGSTEAVSSWTNVHGEARFEVLPGRYAIWVGSRETTVDVLANASVTFEFEPAADGDLLFDLPPNSPKLWLRPADGDEPGVLAVWWHGRVDGRIRQGWFFVPAGEYEVSSGHGLAPIGTVRVRAGKATVFAGPPGGIRAIVASAPVGSLRLEAERFADGQWRLAGVMDELGSFFEYREDPDQPERIRHLPYLTPGTYRIQATESPPGPAGVLGPDRKTEQVVVEVGSGWTDVRLRFEPPR